MQEARHVYLQAGLAYFLESKTENPAPVHILEYGMGTGLNVLLTTLDFPEVKIHYTALEQYPVAWEIAMDMGYDRMDKMASLLLSKIHSSEWHVDLALTTNLTLHKVKTDFRDYENDTKFDVVYFDAFGPRVQPELWDGIAFAKAYKSMKVNGVLSTYCSAGHVRRAMQEAGYKVSKLPGPPGKREMLRAVKR